VAKAAVGVARGAKLGATRSAFGTFPRPIVAASLIFPVALVLHNLLLGGIS